MTVTGQRREPTIVETVRAMHGRAKRESAFSHPVRAIRLVREALALLATAPDPHADGLRARLLLTLAYNLAETEGVEAGLAELAGARRIAEESGDGELLMLVNGQHGVMAYRTGDIDEALRRLDAAAALIEHGSDFDRISIILNRGVLNLYRGRLSSARADLDWAVIAAAAAGLRLEEYKAKHNLGYAEFLAGNLPLALRLLAEAAQDAPERFGATELDRGRVLVESGLIHEAGAALVNAEAVLRRQRQWQDVGEVELARAECALLSGEPRAARQLAARARDRFRRRGSGHWLLRAQLLLLQADLAYGRPGTRLAGPALDVARQLSSSGPSADASTAYRIAAQAFLRAGHPDQAAEAARQAGSVRRGDPITVRLHARLVRAELGLATGERAQARRELRTGLNELATYQARFGSIDLQTASAVHGRRLAQLDLGTALQTGRPGDVLMAVERGRATSTRVVTVSPPTDPEDAQLLSRLRIAVDAAREARAGHDATAEAAQRHSIAELQDRLRDRSWTASGTGRAESIVGVAELLTAARAAGTALVTYFASGGRVGAVVLDSGRPALHDLAATAEVRALIRRCRADFDVLALDRLPDQLRRVAGASLATDLAMLDASLLAPLGLAGRGAVLVTAGGLGTVAWNALPSRRGLPTVAAASASGWARASARPPIEHPLVAALAGPELSRADDEVASVARTWSVARVYRSADRRAVLAAMSGADLVHIAAHGTHQTDSPLFSAVRLADGPVFAHELPASVRASHVVLSACELGRSTLRPGDEALGLTSVLLRTGVQSVVSGVARVNDAAAADTMAAYHRELAAGTDSATALAGALAGQDPAGPVPFVCFGASWRAVPVS